MLEFWIGTTGGVLIGSTGAGLGLIVTPLLILGGYSPAVAVGTLQALTSAGSGSLLAPILASTTDWKVPQMAAVSNLFGALVGALSVGLYFKLGDFNTHLLGKVLVGLLPGVAAGSLLSRWISRHWLVRSIAAVTTVIGVRLLFA